MVSAQESNYHPMVKGIIQKYILIHSFIEIKVTNITLKINKILVYVYNDINYKIQLITTYKLGINVVENIKSIESKK